jgi:hypothetical protein
MLYVIIISFLIGVVIGRFVFRKVVTKVDTVYKEIKVPSEPIVSRPADYCEYLKWKEHKENLIDLVNIIPNEDMEDDEKFERIKNTIEKELSITHNGELN